MKETNVQGNKGSINIQPHPLSASVKILQRQHERTTFALIQATENTTLYIPESVSFFKFSELTFT